MAGALLTIYVESANLNWSYKTNFLFRAFPWFVLGYATKMRCEEYIKRISNYTLCFFICIGWGITISSVVNKIYIDYSYIGVLITAPAMFALCVKNRSINVPTPLSYIGDKLTMYIYILHVPISYFVKKLAKMTSIDSLVGYEYIYPLIVLCASIVISLFVYHIRKSIKSSL